MEIETYQVVPEKHGKGAFFFTDCGNRMYSIKGEMAYHGCLCPKCLMNGKQVTLYIRGSKEANAYWDKKLRHQNEGEKEDDYDISKDETLFQTTLQKLS